jgi:hypothetical protein
MDVKSAARQYIATATDSSAHDVAQGKAQSINLAVRVDGDVCADRVGLHGNDDPVLRQRPSANGPAVARRG